MSLGDIDNLLGRSSVGRNVFEKAFLQSNPSSWIVRLKTARIVEKIRLIDDVDSPLSINQFLN